MSGITRSGKPCQRCAQLGRDCGTCLGPQQAAAGSRQSHGTLDDAVAAETAPAGPVRVDLGDPNAVAVMGTFAEAGEHAWAVGGCVRDRLAGQAPKDIDLAVTTSPENSMRILARLGAVTPIGIDYGTVSVRIDGVDYECTTLRGETYQPGSRHPQVTWGADLDADLARRDFTIGAMAVDVDGQLHDPFGGRADLADGIVRAVGDPELRFVEDPLRIARAVRFAADGGRSIDSDTADAMTAQADGLGSVSAERVAAEIRRIVNSGRPGAYADMVTIAATQGIEGGLFGGDLEPVRHPERLEAPEARWAHLAAGGRDLVAAKYTKAEAAVGRRVLDAAAAEDPAMTVRRHDDATVTAASQYQAAQGQPTPVYPSGHDRERLRAPLPIDGRDVTAAGLRGREVGATLTRIEAEFVARRGHLTRAEALSLIKG